MPFNLTNLTSAEGIYDVASFANEVTEGSFMLLVVLAVFFVLLVGFSYNKDFKVGLASSSFIAFVLSGLLSWAGLVNVFAGRRPTGPIVCSKGKRWQLLTNGSLFELLSLFDCLLGDLHFGSILFGNFHGLIHIQV